MRGGVPILVGSTGGIVAARRGAGRAPGRGRHSRSHPENALEPWLSERWCPAPTADPAVVWPMEGVLDNDARPYDPARPVVCLDETSRRLLGEVRHPARHDPGCVHDGGTDAFLPTEPLRGWRNILVSDQRTRLNPAADLEHPADDCYPDAEAIVPVVDRFATHSPGLAPRRIPRPRCQADRRPPGGPPHAEARLRAERRRAGAGRPGAAVPPPPAPRPRRAGGDGRGPGGPPQRRRRGGRPAVRYPRRPHPTDAAVPHPGTQYSTLHDARGRPDGQRGRGRTGGHRSLR